MNIERIDVGKIALILCLSLEMEKEKRLPKENRGAFTLESF